ncbi:hypothetical protein Lal_00038473 [Lupinus albus]|nr:hypothetical protein Lal_00038473 [Lupinus albus]
MHKPYFPETISLTSEFRSFAPGRILALSDAGLPVDAVDEPVPSLERKIPNLCEPFPGLLARSSITFRPLSAFEEGKGYRRRGIGEPKQAVKDKGEMSGLQWEGAASRAEKVLVKDSKSCKEKELYRASKHI